MPSDSEKETEWIRQIAGGDRAAFEDLYRTYQTRIYRYLFRMLSCRETAEETTNDVLVEVWKSARNFRAQSKPSTWIFGIAHHKALNALRRKPAHTVDLENAGQVRDPRVDPEARSIRADQTETLQRALGKLSEPHREVIQMAFYEGFSCMEIAEIAGCPVSTVKTRMFYARKELGQLLQRGESGGGKPA